MFAKYTSNYINYRIEIFTKIYVNKGKEFLFDLVMFFLVMVHDDIKVISFRRKIAEMLSNHTIFQFIIVWMSILCYESTI